MKPPNTEENQGVSHRFKCQYIVRHSRVVAWLYFPKQNHPGYHDVITDNNLLSQLPENGSVEGRSITHVHDNDESVGQRGTHTGENEQYDDDDNDDEPERVAVPDQNHDRTEMDRLRQALQRGEGLLGVPSFRPTPLAEYNKTQTLLIWCFPMLFPQGEAGYVQSRQRQINYKVLVRHPLHYKDGHFARHPRFRYVTFNTCMQHDINDQAGYFVKKHRPGDITIDDLRPGLR